MLSFCQCFWLTDQHIMTQLSYRLSSEHSCKQKRVISHNVFFTILDLYQNELSFSRTNLRADTIIVYFLWLSYWTSDQKQNHNQEQVIPAKFKVIQPINIWANDSNGKLAKQAINLYTIELYRNKYLK